MIKSYSDTAASDFEWVKSSYSSGDQNCVEIARRSDAVPVRDSKRPHGPALVLHVDTWIAFMNGLKRGL